MKSVTSTRLRALRFISDRYQQRDQAHYFPELLIFGIFAIISVWPFLPVTHAIMRLP
jgi:hypothetical protein